MTASRPNRRGVLQGLVALPLAAAPAVALAASEGDAGLIAQAAKVQVSATRVQRAIRRFGEVVCHAELRYPSFMHERDGTPEGYATHFAKCRAIDLRCGVPAARKLQGRADRRLAVASVRLATMTPTTHAGSAAKARACVAVLGCYEDSDFPGWLSDLVQSTVRDTAAIGGDA